MDTTQDISKIDQLSQVIRYVSVVLDANGYPKTLQINESFIGFVEILDQSGVGLEESIINCITKNNLNLSKLRGQGYDGAANMSGVYSGVQARLKSKQKLATYIHCASHNLNLVLNDAMNSSTEVKNFFGLVEKIYIFFSNSIKHWQLLLSSESSDISFTLKRLCTTRWSSSVVFIGKILETVNVVSKVLQSPKQELSTAVSLLNSALRNLQEYRSQYTDFFEIAVEMAKIWGVPQKFQEKRNRRERFTSLNNVFKIFEVIQPNSLINLTDEQIYNSANKLVKYYDSDLSNALAGQILSFRSCFKEEITKRTSVKEITELLVIENPTLATTFSEICTACITMCEERLSGLGILSIENDRARQLNLKEIINNFAEKKARKRNFH
ncbi:uncharacterized protein LOC126908181 [Daktulosphaira vitifoliae]|uniref:uncharacterized protein LOC126908181 n=1 Tax=Daktulosphaira vitifoliae TaxID=58002 RepID=UPI0021A9A627|nr:uncharacterized protein LOC126908181 [Daktulosphaira vitifoliae]